MKRKLSLTMLMLISVVASITMRAQDTIPLPKVSSSVTLSATKTTWQKNKFGDNWFVSFGSGAQMLFGKDNNKGSFGQRLTYVPSISYGKYFSPLFGIRLNLTGGSIHRFNNGVSGTYRTWSQGKNYQGEGFAGTDGYPANVGEDFLTWDPQWNYLGFRPGTDIIYQDGQYMWEPGTRGETYMQTVHYGALNLNAMLDLVTLFRGYNPNRKFNVTAFAGPTVFHIFPHEGQIAQTNFGANFGLQGKYRLNEYSDFFVEASGTAYPDSFDGHSGKKSSSDMLAQIQLGITCKLGKQRWDRYIEDNGFELVTQLNEEVNKIREKPVKPIIEPKRPVFHLNVNFVAPDMETVKKRALSGEAYVLFEVGKSILLPNLGNNSAELSKICKSIDYVKEEQDASVDRISISGYASPEGSEISNKKLSQSRSSALKDYVKVLYKFDESQFAVISGGENWSGLLDALGRTSLTQSEKSDIANIIRNTSDITARKNKIKAYKGGQPYQYLLKEIYPGLRRTDYKIDYTVSQFSLAKGRQLIISKPSMLSHYEMYTIAKSYTKGSVEFKRATETAYALYPDDEVANINIAAVALDDNDLVRAANCLLKYQKSSRTYNNIGVLYAMQENFDEAERYFNMAKANGVLEASRNLQQLKSIRAEMQKYEEELAEYNKYLDQVRNEATESAKD